MTCERLASGDSVLHAADPRLKLLLAAGFSAVAAVLTCLEGQLMALGGGFVLITASRLSRPLVLSRLFLVNLFVVFIWLILPWSTPGTRVLEFGPLNITNEGLRLAISISLKCNAIVLANMALLSTSTVFSLAHALAHLRVPSKLVQLFFFSWRYLHVMDLEYKRMLKALKARGFEPETNLHTYRTYAYMLGNLFIRSYERGDRVYKAMLCRGFDGTFWLLSHFHLHRRDVVLSGLTSLYISAMAVLEWYLS